MEKKLVFVICIISALNVGSCFVSRMIVRKPSNEMVEKTAVKYESPAPESYSEGPLPPPVTAIHYTLRSAENWDVNP